MSDLLTEYIAEYIEYGYIMSCPNCGGTPEPEFNETKEEVRLECDSCGFSSLYLDTVDDALRNWEEMCNEYMLRQYELLRDAVGMG